MYYGQNKEDEVINNLIVSRYGSDFKGTILDLGANDGITLSNSRYFIENGWKGVLVEAGKLPYQKLMTTILPNTIAINSAIGNQNGVLTFYESTNLLDANDVGLVSSLVASVQGIIFLQFSLSRIFLIFSFVFKIISFNL